MNSDWHDAVSEATFWMALVAVGLLGWVLL